MPTTYSELVSLIAGILPNAQFAENGSGEIVISTGYREDRDGNLHPIKEEREDNE